MSKQSLSFVHQYVPGKGEAAGTTLLLLHGTGGNENDLLDVGRTLLPGATLLSPRGKVLENGMPRFFRRLAEGVFDLEDLHRRTYELVEFIVEACSVYSLDARRIVAVGYSNGANIAASTLLLRPETLSAAILLRPMVSFAPKKLPDLGGKGILVAAGRHDPIANPEQTLQLAELLMGAGADVKLHWHVGAHELGQDDIVASQTWTSLLMRDIKAPRIN